MYVLHNTRQLSLFLTFCEFQCSENKAHNFVQLNTIVKIISTETQNIFCGRKNGCKSVQKCLNSHGPGNDGDADVLVRTQKEGR